MLDSWIQNLYGISHSLACLSSIPSPRKGKICATLLGQANCRVREWVWSAAFLISSLPKGFSNRWNVSLRWLTSLEIISYDTLIGFKFSSSYKYFTFMSCSRKYLFLETPFQDSSVPLFIPLKSSDAVSFFNLPGSSHCPLTAVSVTAPPSESRVATAVNARTPQSFGGLLNWHGKCRCEGAAVCLSAFGHFWPFLAWVVMLAADSPWHMTECSNSSQPVSWWGLKINRKVNLQEQTVLSCHLSAFYILGGWQNYLEKPREKLRVKSWDLYISLFPSPLQILGFLTGWLWTGPQAKTHRAISYNHTTPLWLLSSVDTELLSMGQAPCGCQLPKHSA